MLIDWFTVAAQVVNFLILVALLKHFFYGRIVRAMDEREQRIAARLAEAEQQRQEAAAQARAYRQQQQALEAQQAELLTQARAEAETQRQALLTQAREDLEQLQARWHTALQQEKTAFLQGLRQCVSQQVCAIARQALTDLAHAELEQQVSARFLERLQGLDEPAWQALLAAPQAATRRLVIRSAFELPQHTRLRIQDVLREHSQAMPVVHFQTAPDVLCGIELLSAGHRLAWSLADYLGTLEEHLAAAWEERESESASAPRATAAAVLPV